MGIPASANSSRKLIRWLDYWLDYTEILGSPKRFRLWTGIGLLASALERRVWTVTRGRILYPNQYICLVGPPGVGKSTIIEPAERALRAVGELHIAPSSVTTASLIDSLNGSIRKIVRPTETPNFVQFHSLQVFASELGVFLPSYDAAFMNTLTKLYDGELYEERRRTGKVNHLRIDNPLLSIVAGTTPSYINSFLPDTAWDQGFTSRTLFIFSDEDIRSNIFSEEEDFARLEMDYKGLIADLRLITQLFGKVSWTQEAMNAIKAWNEKGLPPVPEHGKLVHYNSRRLAHCIKLCIIASVSRANDLQIKVEDYQTALNWLLEAEEAMPDIFKSMGVSADARAMEDCWYYIYQLYSKTGKPVRENVIVSFLANRVPSNQVVKIIEIMCRSGALKQEIVGGVPIYSPLKKTVG